MDDSTYKRLFSETRVERVRRLNGVIIGSCPHCKSGFTSKRNMRAHGIAYCSQKPIDRSTSN